MTDPKCEFFTEADCDGVGQLEIIEGRLITHGTAISLNKANRLLAERGTVVYANCTGAAWLKEPFNVRDGYRALLINITPIEKPDTAEKILSDLISEYEVAHNFPGTGLGYRKFYDRAKKLLGEL